MDSLLLIIGTGLCATFVMTGTLLLLDKKDYARSDYFWPLAGLFSEDRSSSRILGIGFHICAGMFFTVIYLALWSIYSPQNPWLYIALGVATGLVHGLIIGIGLIPILFDQGEQGFKIGLTQALAHVAFGFVVGLCAAGLQMSNTDMMKTVDRVVQSSILVADR